MSCRSISSSEIVAFEVEADGKLRAADGALAIYIKGKGKKNVHYQTSGQGHKGYATKTFAIQIYKKMPLTAKANFK